MVFVSINEGIGCGIFFNGGLYRGASGNAGEFGHIIIDTNGPVCHCGNKGCWETFASESYIVNRYLKLPNSNKELTKKEVYQLGKNGDKKIIEIFNLINGYRSVKLLEKQKEQDRKRQNSGKQLPSYRR